MLKKLAFVIIGLLALSSAAFSFSHGTATTYAYIADFNKGYFVDGNLHIVESNDLINYVNRAGYTQYVPHDCCGSGSTAMCGAPNMFFNPNDGYVYVACSLGIDTTSWTANHFEIARSADGNTFTYVTTVTADLATVCAGGHPQSWVESWFVDTDNSVHIGWLCCPNSTSVPLACSEWGLDATVKTGFTATSWSSSTQLAGTGLPADPLNEHITKIGSTYYLFIKDDDTGAKYIDLFSSSSLWTGYTSVETGNWAGWGTPRESPDTLQLINSATNWAILLDPEGTGEMVSFTSSGFPTGTWTTPVSVSAPFQMQHGNAILNPFAN